MCSNSSLHSPTFLTSCNYWELERWPEDQMSSFVENFYWTQMMRRFNQQAKQLEKHQKSWCLHIPFTKREGYLMIHSFQRMKRGVRRESEGKTPKLTISFGYSCHIRQYPINSWCRLLSELAENLGLWNIENQTESLTDSTGLLVLNAPYATLRRCREICASQLSSNYPY